MIHRLELLSWNDTTALFESWADRYAKNPQYWRIDGRPVCSFLNLGDFVEEYGVGGFGLIVQTARKIFARRGLPDLFAVGVFSEADMKNVRLANRLPLDAATGYALLPDWVGLPVQHYADLIPRRVAEWYQVQARLRIPFLPVVCVGWDPTVRGEHVEDVRLAPGFPWRPIVDGVTAPLFGGFIDQALRFNAVSHPELDVVFVHAWNEWTERSSVEPSDVYGYTLLEEIGRRANALPL